MPNDKVVLNHAVRSGPYTGLVKDHYHARELHIDRATGQATITARDGTRHIERADDIVKVGKGVAVRRNGF